MSNICEAELSSIACPGIARRYTTEVDWKTPGGNVKEANAHNKNQFLRGPGVCDQSLTLARVDRIEAEPVPRMVF
jgi:hypothetical protein